MSYKSIHEVPTAWRHLKGWSLSLDQINSIIGSATESDDNFAVALGQEREIFIAQNHVDGGVWVAGSEQ